MSKKTVFCSTTSRAQADEIVDHLRSESFCKNDISVLFASQGAMTEMRHENITKAASDAVAGASPSTFIGEPLNWVAGTGVQALPGLSPFIAAGPIIAALGGASGGDIPGGLMSLGISEVEAHRYERELDNGNVLLCVHIDDAGDIARVKDIFKQAGAQNICVSAATDTKAGTPSEGGTHPARMAVA